MNSYTLQLSSNATSYTSTLPLIELDDHTMFYLDLSRLHKSIIPVFLQIDWGFGEVLTYDNNIFDENNSQPSNFIPLFVDSYSHEYFPSATALYLSLSAQVLVRYATGDYAWFIIPIQIRTYGFAESVGDLTLINTNILPIEENLSEHQLKTSKDGYIIELRGD
jgi:hypothetical protein